MSPNRSAGRSLFAAARTSKDLSLVAFATALFTAFVLQAGAFLPRLDWPRQGGTSTAQVVREPTAPAFATTRDPGTSEEARADTPAPSEPPAARL